MGTTPKPGQRIVRPLPALSNAAIDRHDRLVLDAHQMPTVRICNFELLRRIER